jgi:hypothetical protein
MSRMAASSAIVKRAVGLIKMVENRHVRPALRYALGEPEEFYQ